MLWIGGKIETGSYFLSVKDIYEFEFKLGFNDGLSKFLDYGLYEFKGAVLLTSIVADACFEWGIL